MLSKEYPRQKRKRRQTIAITSPAPLAAYEIDRLESIAENNAFLASLGLEDETSIGG